MEVWPTVVLLVLALLVLFRLRRSRPFARTIVYEYESALRYRKGRLDGVLGAGAYWYMPSGTTLVKMDRRPRYVSVPGQEVMSLDGVAVKASVAATFGIADPVRAMNGSQDYQQALYLELQMALREILGGKNVEEITEGKGELSKRLREVAAPKAADLGLELVSAEVKDVMLPGALKQMFAQVVNARKEGQAALEKARGETAALRNLANAARMLEGNPALLQLRILQTIDRSPGSTVVLDPTGHLSTLPLRPKEGASSPPPPPPAD